MARCPAGTLMFTFSINSLMSRRRPRAALSAPSARPRFLDKGWRDENHAIGDSKH